MTDINSNTPNKKDGRMTNRDSSIRKLYTARDVVNFVDMVDTAIEDGRAY